MAAFGKITELDDRIKRDARGFFSEFWAFAAKGNVLDLAVGVILGTAFSAIVNSLVADVVMPLLSIVTGNVENLSNLGYTLRAPIGSQEAIVIGYGKLLQAAINFLVIGLSIFLFFKTFVRIRERLMRREKAEEKAAPPDPVSTQEKLLCEIRDLLKEQNQRTSQ